MSNPSHVSSGVAHAQLDGAPVNANAIPLVDDGATHDVIVELGVTVSSALNNAATTRAR